MLFTKFLMCMAFSAMATSGLIAANNRKAPVRSIEDFVEVQEENVAKRQTRDFCSH